MIDGKQNKEEENREQNKEEENMYIVRDGKQNKEEEQGLLLNVN